jgi:tetratricopeptide (TPR) repeat protein
MIGSQPGDDITVETAAHWCQKVLCIDILDSLWYERVGETYRRESDYGGAIEAFEAALTLNDSCSKCFEGLALSLAKDDKIREACAKMNEALHILEREDNPNKTDLVRLYKHLGEWYAELQEPASAKEYIEKWLALAPSDHRAHWNLLKIYLANNSAESVTKLFGVLAKEHDIERGPSQVGRIMEELVKDSESDELFIKLLSILSPYPELFKTILRELDGAIDTCKTEEGNRSYELATLLFYKGVVIYHCSQEGTNSAKFAIDCWEKCLKVDVVWGWTDTRSQAFRFISSHHFNQAIAWKESANEQKHAKRLETIVTAENQFDMSAARSYLAAYYKLSNNLASARMVLKSSIGFAFDILSDDTTKNDCWDYYRLASILLHYGDDLNALSAFSLLLPKPTKKSVMTWLLDFTENPERSLSLDLISVMEKECSSDTLFGQIHFILEQVDERSSADADDSHRASRLEGYNKIKSTLQEWSKVAKYNPFGWLCDGHCEPRRWDFDNPGYACKYCHDRGFCSECLAKLKKGEQQFCASSLDGLVCRKNHDWLYLPKWDKESFLRALAGNVQIGGRIEQGIRVGGETVTIEEWLETLKKNWGFVEETERAEE